MLGNDVFDRLKVVQNHRGTFIFQEELQVHTIRERFGEYMDLIKKLRNRYGNGSLWKGLADVEALYDVYKSCPESHVRQPTCRPARLAHKNYQVTKGLLPTMKPIGNHPIRPADIAVVGKDIPVLGCHKVAAKVFRVAKYKQAKKEIRRPKATSIATGVLERDGVSILGRMKVNAKDKGSIQDILYKSLCTKKLPNSDFDDDDDDVECLGTLAPPDCVTSSSTSMSVLLLDPTTTRSHDTITLTCREQLALLQEQNKAKALWLQERQLEMNEKKEETKRQVLLALVSSLANIQ
jgi:hypothetical protein